MSVNVFIPTGCMRPRPRKPQVYERQLGCLRPFGEPSFQMPYLGGASADLGPKATTDNLELVVNVGPKVSPL